MQISSPLRLGVAASAMFGAGLLLFSASGPGGSAEARASDESEALLLLVFTLGSIGGAALCLLTLAIVRQFCDGRRQSAEPATGTSEQRLRAMLEGTAAYLALLDRSGVVLEVNSAPLEATQQTRENVIGRRIWETYGWSYSEAEQRRVQDLVERAARGEYVSDDLDIVTHDGRILTLESRIIPLWENGRITNMIGSAIDVTERKRVERALRASEQRLRLLLDTATLAVSTLDLEKLLAGLMDRLAEVIPTADVGTIFLYDEQQDVLYPAAYRSFDDEAHRQIRLQPGESLSGKAFQTGQSYQSSSIEQADSIRGELRPEIAALFRKIVAGRRIQSNIAAPLKTPSGETIGVLTMSSTNANFQEEDLTLLQGIAAFVAMAVQNARLYQHERQYAEELERTVSQRTAELRDANRELESFVHTVAHDLRAPLRAMHGFARALQEDCSQQLDATGQEYVQYVVDAAQRMDLLIRELLAYSLIGRSEVTFAPVSLEDALSEARSQLKSDIAERNVVIDVEHPLPTVSAQHSLLVQVLSNLLSNAIKFVPPDRQPHIRVWAEKPDGSWKLFVEDNGIGIPAEHHERIFRVFERLHGIEEYAGTGIGLAIVSRACAWMNGSCGVESMPGQGSRFWVELPAAPENESSLEAPAARRD